MRPTRPPPRRYCRNPGQPAERGTRAPTLAEIAELADDFERNHALYELVAGSGRAQVEDLLELTFDLPPSLHRHDIVRVLYVRFAAIDPVAALEHLLGSHPQPRSSLTAIFRVWAHADIDEAVRRAATLDQPEKGVVARAFFDMEMPGWQRQDIAEQLEATTALAQVRAREELAAGSPEQAWGNALAGPPGPQRQRQLAIAINAWAEKDPEAALRAASEIEDDSGLYLSASVLSQWVKADRPAALNWLSLQDPSRRTKVLTMTMARGLAEAGIAEALDALEDVPGWARQDMQQAILSRWMTVDPAAAIAWLGSLPLADQQELSSSMAYEYARRDPRGAFDWAMAVDPKIRDRLLSSVLISIADADIAEQLFRSIDDAELRADLTYALFLGRADGDPVEALRWATTFQGDVQDKLRSYIFTNWAKADPDAAVREVLRQRDPAARDRVATQVISGLLDTFNVAAAERLFQAIDSVEARGQAARSSILLRTNRRRSRKGGVLPGDLARQQAPRAVKRYRKCVSLVEHLIRIERRYAPWPTNQTTADAGPSSGAHARDRPDSRTALAECRAGAVAGPAGEPLAYVLVSGRVIDDTGLEAYGEAAGPLAQAAGINVVARAETANVHVMEGEWPHADGFIAIETFTSMDEFTDFWNSPGYQEAIELRKGKVELDFVVALEGLPDS